MSGCAMSTLPTPGKLSLTKDEAADFMRAGVSRMSVWEETLYADDRYGVLLIFQGMDASGKDGVVKRVLSGVNPQG
jgi:polyphosphate kinase 2 (PPK2 family)